MHAVRSASKPAPERDSDAAAFTPRGMAAPPPARVASSVDHDSSRPATIRIEAKTADRLVAHRRADLERELARVQAATPAPTASPGKPGNGLLLAQGLLLNAFGLLLVFGWSSPLPGRPLLLVALALAGVVVAGLVYMTLQAARDGFALRALTATFAAGWVGLSVYALALSPSANAFVETRAPAVTSAATPAVRLPTRATVSTPQQPVDVTPVKDSVPAQPAKRSSFSW